MIAMWTISYGAGTEIGGCALPQKVTAPSTLRPFSSVRALVPNNKILIPMPITHQFQFPSNLTDRTRPHAFHMEGDSIVEQIALPGGDPYLLRFDQLVTNVNMFVNGPAASGGSSSGISEGQVADGIVIALGGVYFFTLTFTTWAKEHEIDDDVTVYLRTAQLKTLCTALKGEQSPRVVPGGYSRHTASASCVARLNQYDILNVFVHGDGVPPLINGHQATQWRIIHRCFSGYYLGQE